MVLDESSSSSFSAAAEAPSRAGPRHRRTGSPAGLVGSPSRTTPEPETSHGVAASRETPAADAVSARHHRRPHSRLETDLSTNPTELCRLLIRQKFASAAKRLRKHPSEASTWLCVYPPSLVVGPRPPAHRRPSWPSNTPRCTCTNEDTERVYRLGPVPSHGRPYDSNGSASQAIEDVTARSLSTAQPTFRQLPIHLACSYLQWIHAGLPLREDLERLILYLVSCFPEGCAHRDHDQQYPLWMTIQWNASPIVVKTMIRIFPRPLLLLHDPQVLLLTAKRQLQRTRSGDSDDQSKEYHSPLDNHSNSWTNIPHDTSHVTDTDWHTRTISKPILDLVRQASDYLHQSQREAMLRFTLVLSAVASTGNSALDDARSDEGTATSSPTGQSEAHNSLTSMQFPPPSILPADTSTVIVSAGLDDLAQSTAYVLSSDVNNNSSGNIVGASNSDCQHNRSRPVSSSNENSLSSLPTPQSQHTPSKRTARRASASGISMTGTVTSFDLSTASTDSQSLQQESVQNSSGSLSASVPAHTGITSTSKVNNNTANSAHRRRSARASESQKTQRERHLERLLMEMMHRNHQLVQAADYPHRFVSVSTQEQQMLDLQDENSDLKKRSLQLDNEDEEIEDEEAIAMLGMDPEKPTALTKYLEGKVSTLQQLNNQLMEENEAYQLRIHELERQLTLASGPKTADPNTTETTEDTSAAAEESDGSYFIPLQLSPPTGTRQIPSLSAHSIAQSMAETIHSEESSVSVPMKVNRLYSQQPQVTSILQRTPSIESETSEDHLPADADDVARQQQPSERERELVSQVQELLKQLDSIRSNRQQQERQEQTQTLSPAPSQKQRTLSVLSASSSLGSCNDDSSCSNNPLDLEARLRIVDKKSGAAGRSASSRCRKRSRNRRRNRKQSNALSVASGREDCYDDDDSDSTPQTRNSSLTGAEYSYQVGSKASTASRGDNSVSSSSWGLLSLTQKKKKSDQRRRRQSKRSTMSVLPTLEQGQNSFNTLSFHDSLRSFADTVRHEMDNLDDMCKAAAEFYDADRAEQWGHKSAIDFATSDSLLPLSLSNHSQQRRFSDGGAPPALTVQKHILNESLHGPEAPDPLVVTARILAAEEDLIAIVRTAEEQLDQSLPRDLFIALRDMSLKTASEPASRSDNSGTNASPTRSDIYNKYYTVAEAIINYKILDEVEQVCQRKIPLSAVSALRTAAQRRLDNTQKEIATMERLKVRLKEEFFDALVEQAERQIHRSLPSALVQSLRDAGSRFDNLMYEVDTGDCQLQHSTGGMRIDFKEVDRMLKEAQQIYGSQFPQPTLISLRRALFVLQSRLEGNDSGEDPLSPDYSSHSSLHSKMGYSESAEGDYLDDGYGTGNVSDGDNSGVGDSSTELHGALIEETAGEITSATNDSSSRSSMLKDHGPNRPNDDRRGISDTSAASRATSTSRSKTEEQSEATSLADTKTSSAEASLSLHNIFPGFESSKGGSVATHSTSRTDGLKLDKIVEASASELSPAKRGHSKAKAVAELYEKTAETLSRSPSPDARQNNRYVSKKKEKEQQRMKSPTRLTRLAGAVIRDQTFATRYPQLNELPPQHDFEGLLSQITDVPVVQSMSLHSIPYEPEIPPEMATEQNRDDEISVEMEAALMLLSKSSGMSFSQSILDDDESDSDSALDVRAQGSVFISVDGSSHRGHLQLQDVDDRSKQQTDEAPKRLQSSSNELMAHDGFLDHLESNDISKNTHRAALTADDALPEKPNSARADPDEKESDDVRSHDMSRKSRMSKESEISMDMNAVFEIGAERKAYSEKQLDSGSRDGGEGCSAIETRLYRGHSSLRELSTSATKKNMLLAEQSQSMARLPRIRSTRSGNLDRLASTARDVPRRGRLRATKSDDLTSLAAFTRPTDNLVRLTTTIGSDDLDMLYKQAKAVETVNTECGGQKLQLPDESGETALHNIVDDTEATYGIEIPDLMVEALTQACLGRAGNAMTFLMVVKALHDDAAIAKAEEVYGEALPLDLLSAMRNVALPPGISKEKLLGNDADTNGAKDASITPDAVSTKSGKKEIQFEVDEAPANAAPPGYLPDNYQALSNELNGRSKKQGDNELARPGSFNERHSGHSHKSGLSQGSGKHGKLIDALDLSMHSARSETSWTKLTHTAVPSRNIKQLRKQVEQSAKLAAQAERKKRAEAEQFMNSLADFGPHTDDLRDLYRDAAASFDSFPLKAVSKMNEARDTKKLEKKPNLAILTEVSESHDESSTSFASSGFHGTSRPASSKSFEQHSALDVELESLIRETSVYYGMPLPQDIEDALRRAFKAEDKSSPKDGIINIDTVFGTHLDHEKVELLLAKVLAGRRSPIPKAVLAALRKAYGALLKRQRKESDKERSDSEAKVTSIINNREEDYSQSVILRTPKQSKRAVNASENTSDRNSEDMPLITASGPHSDSLSGMYKSAYLESPRPQSEGIELKGNSPPAPPSFTTPISMKVPLTEVATPDGATGMERTASGRIVLDLSPMTDNSMSVGAVPSKEITQSVEASKARLDALNNSVSQPHSCEACEPNDTIVPDSSPDKTAGRTEQTTLSSDSPIVTGGIGQRKLSPDVMAELDSLSDQPGACNGTDEFNDSRNASAELDAIIAETQEEFGMELPDELVEALKRTSIHTLLSDTDAMNMSEISSLVMDALNFDEEDADGKSTVSESVEMMTALRNKLNSVSSHSGSQHIGSNRKPPTPTPPPVSAAEFNENFSVFITTAEHEHGQQIPRDVVLAVRDAVLKNDRFELARLHSDEITATLAIAASALKRELPANLVRAFRTAARSFRGINLSEHFKKQKMSTDDTVSYGNASGYFSALSESYVSEPGLDDADLRLQYILDEVKELNGDLPNSLVKTLEQVHTLQQQQQPNNPISEQRDADVCHSANGSEGSGSFGAQAENQSESQLDYSASTFASFSLSPKGRASKSHSLPIPEQEKATGMHMVNKAVNRVAEGCGREVPADVVLALQQATTVHAQGGDGAPCPVVGDTEYLQTLNDAQQDAAHTSGYLSSRALTLTRDASGRFSEISADTDFDDLASSDTPWTNDDNADSVDNLQRDTGASAQEQSQPALRTASQLLLGVNPGPSAQQPATPNKHLGPSILFVLKKSYPEKLPRELCYVLTRSTALSYAMNTDDEIDIILRECEEMSGYRLPADLVVALREASVANRSSDVASRSKRSRLIHQSSGSFRSSSRSSAMPSIQEDSIRLGRNRTSDDSNSVERIGTIAFDTGSDGKSSKPTGRPSTPDVDGDLTDDNSTTSSITFQTKQSAESASLDELQTPHKKPRSGRRLGDRGTNLKSNEIGTSHTTNALENSMSTIQMSNIGSNAKWKASPSSNGSSSNGSRPSSRMRIQMDMPIHEMSLDLDDADGIDETVSRGVASRASSSSTETSFSTSKMSNISRASTLPSKKAVLGVNSTLPLEGMESDDLSAIFREAARRMSR